MTRSRLRIARIALVAVAVMCRSAGAEAQNVGSGGNNSDLLPGLDTRLIDKSADPCVDFFQYACGNFSKLYPIPSDRASFGTGAMIAEHAEKVLHTMLEKAAAGGADRTANEQKIGDYYAACMDTKSINQEGLKPLQPELDRIVALKDKSELPALLAHFQLINVSAFLSFGEQQDFKDARKQIAVVDQGGLGLPERDYYFRPGDAAEETRKQYVQHITNTLKLMGEPESQASGDAQRIMQLETALAKVSLDVTSQRDPNKIYHMMPLTDLQKLTPNLNWSRFLSELGAPPVTELNVANPDFFKGLAALLDSTDLKTIKTYLGWQLIRSTDGIVLPEAFDKQAFDFYAKS